MNGNDARTMADPADPRAMDTSPASRIIVALDYGAFDDAIQFVDDLAGTVSFFKVGLELFVAAGPDMVRALQERGHRVFLDLKMDDVVETITRAVRQVAALGPHFLTILGGPATARAACAGRGANERPKILCVTMLTSLGEDDLRYLGLLGGQARFKSVQEYVEWRADQALENGCDGLITSGQNARALRERFGARNPIIVCPGIRPSGASHNEHKRASTPYDAMKDGADYIVVGRPIRDADNRKDAARRIIDEVEKGLKDRGR